MIRTGEKMDPRLRDIMNEFSPTFMGQGDADRNYHDRFDHAVNTCDPKTCHYCRTQRTAKRRAAKQPILD